MFFINFTKRISVLFCCCCLLQPEAMATTYGFVGGGENNSWTNAANWASGAYPGTTIMSGDEVIINSNCYIGSGITITNEGTLINNAQFTNESNLHIYGTFSNTAIGLFKNINTFHLFTTGTFTNHGLIENEDYGIENFIKNEGTFFNSAGATFSNYGWFQIFPSGTLINQGQINNMIDATTFYSQGNFTNDTGASLVNNELITLSGGMFTNDGTLINNERLNLYDQVTFTNAGSLNNNSYLYIHYNNENNAFTNSGTLTNNDRLLALSMEITNTASGVIYNQNEFDIHTEFFNNGTFNNLSSMTVKKDFINNKTLSNSSSLEILNIGTLTNNMEFYNWSAGDLTINGIFNNQSAGTFLSNGDIINNKTFNNYGETELNGAFTNNLNFNQFTGAEFENNGTIYNSTSGIYSSDGMLSNHLTFGNAGDMEVNGTFINNMEFNNWSTGFFSNNGIFKHEGTQINNGSNITLATGSLQGNGTITGNINNVLGSLSPGASPGILAATGSINLLNSATYKAEIAGNGMAGETNGFDQVNVGDANLGGTLQIILLNDFVPNINDEYIVLTSAGTINTTFDNISLPAGHDFLVTYNSNNVTIKYVGSLPVELLSFNGRKVNDHIQLNWQTAIELNNAGFEIQKMDRNNKWTIIDFVEGKGTTELLQNYTHLDQRPLLGENYYRLKQIDYDGQYEFSDIVNVRFKQQPDIQIYPNPAQTHVYIRHLQNNSLPVEIWDYSGKLWLTKFINNNDNKVDLNTLPNGIYFVRLEVNREILTRKIVVE